MIFKMRKLKNPFINAKYTPEEFKEYVPNIKHQIPNKSQIPKTNDQNR